MKLVLLNIVFIFFGVYSLFSQTNLVPNSSFEQLKKCPDTEEDIAKVLDYWYNTTMVPSAIFNPCANGKPPFVDGISYFGMPYNAGGFQQALDSIGYASFGVEYGSNQREYLSVMLKDSLKKGSVYRACFYVSCIDDGKYAADELGLYLSKDSIYKHTPYYLNYNPQIKSEKGVPIDDTLNWVEISGLYTARGGEKYITIGQFKSDSKTTWKTINPNGTSNCFYYLDMVSVKLLRDSIPPPKNPHYTLYPNPASDKISISFEDMEPTEVALELYDMLGRKILAVQPKLQAKQFETNIQFLAAGVYIYRLQVDGAYLGDGKLIIVR